MRPAISSSRSESLVDSNSLQRVGNRQPHQLRDGAPLHLDGAAFGPQPIAVAAPAWPKGAIALDIGLVDPRRLLVAAAQVRDDALEALPVRVLLARGGSRLRRRPVEQQVLRALRQLAERHREVNLEVAAERRHGLLHQVRIARGPRRDGALQHRQRGVGHDALGIEIPQGAQALAVGTPAVGRVEGERSRRHLRDAQAAVHTCQGPGEQPVSLVEGVDEDHVPREMKGHLDRVGQAPLDAGLDDQAIDDDFDRVVAAPVEHDVVLEGSHLAVDAGLEESPLAPRSQVLLELAFTAADDRRQNVDPQVVRIRHQLRHDLVGGLRRDREAAARAVRDADVREQQAEVVVDLRHRPDRRPRVGARRLLLDRQGRRQALDRVDVRLLHLVEELAGVGRQRLDVAPLSLGVDRVEGERRLAGSRQPRDDHELVARQVHVDPFQVVDARAADGDLAGTHGARHWALGARG